MINIRLEDALGAGKSQVVMSNDFLTLIIVPDPGGRIAEIRSGGSTFLHRTYPNGINFGPYTEYGGIEECIGSAPGLLWNAPWSYERRTDGVLLRALSRDILVNKFVKLHDSEPMIIINYELSNIGNTFSKFTFGIHSEISIDHDHKNVEYHIPQELEEVEGKYERPGVKKSFTPKYGWWAITDNGKVFGQIFPEGIVDSLTVYYPVVDTHLVLQPVIYTGLSPGSKVSFECVMYAGSGDVEKIRSLYESLKPELSARYETFNAEEISEELLSSLRAHQKARREFIYRAPKEQMKQRAGFDLQIPKIPDIASIVREAITNAEMEVKKALNDVRAQFGLDLGNKITELNRGQIAPKQGQIEGDIIKIDAVRGDITIHCKAVQEINYRMNFGTLEKHNGVVTFRSINDDLSLEVPETVSNISANLVNGNVKILDTISSVKVSAVRGNVQANVKVPGDGSIDISLIAGDIVLRIPSDSKCKISAVAWNGEIDCAFTLDDEHRTKNQLSGVLNDGNATISLKTVSGRISIASY